MSNAIEPFVCTTDILELAKTFAQTDMVPKSYQGKPANIIVAWEAGHALGLSRMFALQNFAVINGKPSLYGDAPLAVIRASGLLEYIDELDGADALAAGEGRCTMKRKGCEPKTTRFTVEMAKQAGLWGKQGPWQTCPGRMLIFRARGFNVRDTFGDVLGGIGIGEEQDDFTVDEPRGSVEVLTPRSKTGQSPEGLAALQAFNQQTQAPAPKPLPPARPAQAPAASSQAATSAGPVTGDLYIMKSATDKNSQDGKKHWVALELDDRDNGVIKECTTFSDSMGALAKSLLGKPVMAEIKAVEKGGKTYHNLISLAAYEAPDDGSPL